MALGSCRSAASDLQLPVAGTALCGGLDNCSGLADNNQFACRSLRHLCQNSVADCRIEGADARQNCGRTPNLVGTSVHACTEHTDFHDVVVVELGFKGGILSERAWDRWGICNHMSCLPPFSTNTVRALLLAAV